MTDEEFKQLVADAIDSLPEWVLGKVENISFRINDLPSAEQKATQGLTEEDAIFGLYEGVPLTERGNSSIDLPDTITIFKKPILDTYTDLENIRACVRNTVWHEVGHHFGHDEEWIAKEEVRRGKTL